MALSCVDERPAQPANAADRATRGSRLPRRWAAAHTTLRGNDRQGIQTMEEDEKTARAPGSQARAEVAGAVAPCEYAESIYENSVVAADRSLSVAVQIGWGCSVAQIALHPAG
jgi:hypothetical protein